MSKPNIITFQAAEVVETSDTDNLSIPTYMNQGWSSKEMSKLREPQIMGFLHGEQKQNFSQFTPDNLLNIEQLEIKQPSSLDYHLPQELAHFTELVKKIAAYENKLNKNILDYYAYLSVEQKEVKISEQKKRPLYLYDYENQKENIEVSHSYLVYDKSPPLFLRQKFIIGYNWDRSQHNYVLGLERQADSENKIYCDPYSILLISPYEPYEEGITYKDGMRTQLRVLFSITPRDNSPSKISKLSMPPELTQDAIEAAALIDKMQKQIDKEPRKNKKRESKTKDTNNENNKAENIEMPDYD